MMLVGCWRTDTGRPLQTFETFDLTPRSRGFTATISGGSPASRVNGRKVEWVAAQGRGGQYIRVVPEPISSSTAGYYRNYSPRAGQVQFGVFRDVVRASLPLN